MAVPTIPSHIDPSRGSRNYSPFLGGCIVNEDMRSLVRAQNIDLLIPKMCDMKRV